MNSKPNIRTLVVTASVLLFAFALPVFSQTPSPSVSPSPMMQMQDMNQMPSMMSDSMTKMSEMCMTMMQQEKAAMPYIIGTATLLFLLLTIALVLLIVLEIQWIKYWSRILHQNVAGSRSP